MKRFILLALAFAVFPSLAFSTSVILPQTGQTTCYDSSGNIIACANTNQDGEIRSGMEWPNPRFVNNNNGTIVDKLTNLVWTEDANAPEYSACDVSQAMSWQDALGYIDCLNTSNYLGLNDWALPNATQLTSLINLQEAQNTVPLANAGFLGVQDADYWTSDSFAADPSRAWTVAIDDGHNADNDKAASFNHVWPVRFAPDLVVTRVGAPTSIKTGQSITISATYKNLGVIDSLPSAGFYVDLYLSTDNVITTADTKLTRKTSGALTVGEDATYDYTFIMPQVAAGNYYFGAIIDDPSYNYESDETNNSTSAAQATAVTYGPDLKVMSVEAPDTIKTGQQITISANYKNIGIGDCSPSAGFYVDFYLSADSVITSADTKLTRKTSGALTVGEDATSDYTFVMPQVTAGNYYFGAIIDDPSYNYESDEDNNSTPASHATGVTYGPDLFVTSVSVDPSDTIEAGQEITVTADYKNIGTGDCAPWAGFYVDLYRSTDNVITTADTRIARKVSGALTAGQEGTYSYTFTLPSGEYYFGAILDDYNYNYESDENNNATAAPGKLTVTSP